MGDGPEDMKDQFFSSGCDIDTFFKADQTDVLSFQVFNDFQQFLERSAKAIQPRDGKTASGAGVVEQRAQSRAIKLLSRNDILEHADSASFLQAGNLTRHVLV